LSNIASIATGYYYSMGVKKDGTVLSLGGGDVGSWSLAHPGFSESEYAEYAAIFLGLGNSRSIEGLSNAVVVGIGVDLAFGSMALKRDGTVVQISLENQLTGHQLLSNAIAISGGWDGLALKEDGTVVGWGTAGEVPPGLSNVVAISGGRRNNLALKRDGTLVMWGGFSPRDLAVPTGLRNVVAISVGQGFFMAITTSPP
jgi:alpha-tubulin suppressor-like RCC1 family protein